MSDHVTKEDIISRLKKNEFGPDDILLDAGGNWFMKGEPVDNPMTAIILSRLITGGKDGYLLSIQGHQVPVKVEDAPLNVMEVRFEGFTDCETVNITLSNGKTEELDPSSLYFRRDRKTLYCADSNGLTARFSLVASIVLLDRLEEDEGGLHLRIDGNNWEIPRI